MKQHGAGMRLRGVAVAKAGSESDAVPQMVSQVLTADYADELQDAGGCCEALRVRGDGIEEFGRVRVFVL